MSDPMYDAKALEGIFNTLRGQPTRSAFLEIRCFSAAQLQTAWDAARESGCTYSTLTDTDYQGGRAAIIFASGTPESLQKFAQLLMNQGNATTEIVGD